MKDLKTIRMGEVEQALTDRDNRIAELEAKLAEVDRARVDAIAALRERIDAAEAKLARCREALESFRHIDGCFCEASFSGPGSHPIHSPECQAAREALDFDKAPLTGQKKEGQTS
jgi:hypothetical protein